MLELLKIPTASVSVRNDHRNCAARSRNDRLLYFYLAGITTFLSSLFVQPHSPSSVDFVVLPPYCRPPPTSPRVLRCTFYCRSTQGTGKIEISGTSDEVFRVVDPWSCVRRLRHAVFARSRSCVAQSAHSTRIHVRLKVFLDGECLTRSSNGAFVSSSKVHSSKLCLDLINLP